MSETRPLYIGAANNVLAIDRATGSVIWRCQLKASRFITMSNIATVAVEPDAVYAGFDGELFCIDADSGAVRWHNPLSDLRAPMVVFGGSSSTGGVAGQGAAAGVAAAGGATLGA